MKTLLDGIMYWCKKMFLSKDEVNDYIAQPDWNENDPESPAYIKNRIGGYIEYTDNIIFDDTPVSHFNDNIGYYYLIPLNHRRLHLEECNYTLWIDGEEYKLNADFSYSYLYFDNDGSHKYSPSIYIDIYGVDGIGVELGYPLPTVENIKFIESGNIINVIPEEYTGLDITKEKLENDIDTISRLANNADIKAAYVRTDINENIKPKLQEIDGKMEKTNPSGTGSFSMNREKSSDIGYYSHAEGCSCVASGFASHSEGYKCVASGNYSHGEGNVTRARGDWSHAEGFDTIASAPVQHVSGCGNIPNSEIVSGSKVAIAKYLEIVGNAKNCNQSTSMLELSNARTLDWQGNAWYAGDVYVGSTSGVNKDEGSKKLATEEYVDTKLGTIESLADEILEVI